MKPPTRIQLEIRPTTDSLGKSLYYQATEYYRWQLLDDNPWIDIRMPILRRTNEIRDTILRATRDMATKEHNHEDNTGTETP